MKKILTLSFLSITIAVTILYYSTQQADITFQKAHRLFVKGKHTQAIPLYEQSLSIDPTRFLCKKELAYCYLWTDRVKKAIDLLSELVQAYPEKYALQYSLAEAYSWSKQYEKAISLMSDLVQKTDDPDVAYHLAEVYIWNKQIKNAIPLLEKLIQNNPENTKAKILLGKAFYYSGESKKASQIFEQILKKEESNR